MEAEVMKSGSAYAFMQGSGEMQERTRNYDWSQSPLGMPDQWPQSLRTTLGIILNSKFPMLLFWGNDHICFYNDAFRPSLGEKGKHPGIGKNGKEVWSDIWDFIGPLIDSVKNTGVPVWYENQLVPFYRNGTTENIYWTFSYSPAYGDDGRIDGVFVTCVETTKTVTTLQQLEESRQQLAFAIDAAELARWDYHPFTHQFTADARFTEWFGLMAEEATDSALVLNIIAPEDRERLVAELNTAMDPAYNGRFNVEYTIRPHNLQERVVRAKGKTWFDEGGNAYRLSGTLQDVTEQVNQRTKSIESEQQVKAIIESAPFPIGIYVGREMRIQFVNQTIKDIWGKGNDIEGKLYAEVLPELENQQVYQQLDGVYATGVPFEARHQRIDILVDGKLQPFYFNYNFTPLFDTNGNVYGVMNTAAEVTDLVNTQLQLKEVEENLRNIILQAPVAMALLRGKDQIIEIANDRMFELWGKSSEELLGKSVFDGLPEVRAQGYEELLDKVFTTGETVKFFGSPVTLPRNGQIELCYIDFVYEAYRLGEDEISGVMVVAIDVTTQVLNAKKIRDAEERGRLAIESAELGTYEINLTNKQLLASARMAEIFNVEEAADRQAYIRAIHLEDLPLRKDAYKRAFETGILEYDARVIYKNGSIHWVRVKGQVFFDDQHTPKTIVGVVQDITETKLFEQELTRQVRERTRELEASNFDLQRSNANLEEFAHAASHDLKEPIRKIRFFTSRLKEQMTEELSDSQKFTFSRIDNASERMTALIDDLLLYSHVSRKPIETEAVDLNEKIKRVLEDLELDIQQKNAKITVGPLPVVQGYRRQLQQLFHNLLTNAIKYNKPNIAPEVSITASLVEGKNVVIGGSPLDATQPYHLIEIRDSGIGFDQKESERIFQMFTRLHGNTEYGGTGVGLSIVRKVVENHSGKIVAEGEPGAGANFKVYLPAS
jgi:PAS domain S-box-containing protein